MKRAHMTTLDTHDSWQLMCKHDWPMRVVDGSDERTGCEADIATAVTRVRNMHANIMNKTADIWWFLAILMECTKESHSFFENRSQKW